MVMADDWSVYDGDELGLIDSFILDWYNGLDDVEMVYLGMIRLNHHGSQQDSHGQGEWVTQRHYGNATAQIWGYPSMVALTCDLFQGKFNREICPMNQARKSHQESRSVHISNPSYLMVDHQRIIAKQGWFLKSWISTQLVVSKMTISLLGSSISNPWHANAGTPAWPHQVVEHLSPGLAHVGKRSTKANFASKHPALRSAVGLLPSAVCFQQLLPPIHTNWWSLPQSVRTVLEKKKWSGKSFQTAQTATAATAPTTPKHTAPTTATTMVTNSRMDWPRSPTGASGDLPPGDGCGIDHVTSISLCLCTCLIACLSRWTNQLIDIHLG